MLSDLAQLGLDDEVLRHEILKLRARRAHIHPSPPPRSKSAHHAERVIEVKRKQSQTSRAERSHLSHGDRSTTRARPLDSSPVWSGKSRSTNRSHASPVRSSSKARNEKQQQLFQQKRSVWSRRGSQDNIPRNMAIFLHENESRRRSDSAADFVSTLQLSRASTTQTRIPSSPATV